MDDVKSVGLTARSRDVLERITDLEWFPENQDAARFALAYAIHAKVGVGTTDGTTTAWTAGLFDQTGEIRALIKSFYPECDTPVRQMEHLVNEGLLLLEENLKAGNLTPTDLFAEPAASNQ